MTTRSIVPNGDGEGSLGTSTAKWGAVYSSDPASGENSGQVPTTAWVQKLVAKALKTAKNEIYKQAKLDAHPVGSYYWSNDSTSPATLFGGTWEVLPAGYTLIAQGSGSDDFGIYTYTAGQKYGERKHQLTTDELPNHSHPASISSAGEHTHTYAYKNSSYPIPSSGNWSLRATGSTKHTTDAAGAHSHTITIGNTGGGQPHNTLPPSIACYGWRRTA